MKDTKRDRAIKLIATGILVANGNTSPTEAVKGFFAESLVEILTHTTNM